MKSVAQVYLHVHAYFSVGCVYAHMLWSRSHRLFGAGTRGTLMGSPQLSAQKMCSLTAWLIKTSTQLFSHSQKRINSCLDWFMLIKNQIKQCSIDQLVMILNFYHVDFLFVYTACPVCTMYITQMCKYVMCALIQALSYICMRLHGSATWGKWMCKEPGTRATHSSALAGA